MLTLIKEIDFSREPGQEVPTRKGMKKVPNCVVDIYDPIQEILNRRFSYDETRKRFRLPPDIRLLFGKLKAIIPGHMRGGVSFFKSCSAMHMQIYVSVKRLMFLDEGVFYKTVLGHRPNEEGDDYTSKRSFSR